jgi:hypothetical protein
MVVALFVANAAIANAQPGDLLWTWYVGTDREFTDIAIAQDRTIITASKRLNITRSDWFRIDSLGSLIQNGSNIGAPDNTRAISVSEDGSFWLAGGRWNSGQWDIEWEGTIWSYSSDGSMAWDMTFDLPTDPEIEIFYGAAADDSGNVIVGGTWFADNVQPQESSFVRIYNITPTGDSVWTRLLPHSTNQETAWQIVKVTGEDAFVAVGMTGSSAYTHAVSRIWKFTSDGVRLGSNVARKRQPKRSIWCSIHI